MGRARNLEVSIALWASQKLSRLCFFAPRNVELYITSRVNLVQIAIAMMALLLLDESPAAGNGGLPQGLRVVRLEHQLSNNWLQISSSGLKGSQSTISR